MTQTLNAASPTADIGRAVSLFQSGDLDGAEGVCREIIRLQSQHWEAFHVLGVVALQKRQLAAGADLIRISLEINPAQANALCSLGNALRDLQCPGEALSSYQRALQLAPQFAGAHYGAGNALHDLGRLQEALEHYDRALELQPDLGPACLNRGNSLLALGLPQRALESYLQALTLQPDSGLALANCAIALRQLGRPREALRFYERLAALDGAAVEALIGIGATLLELHREREALVSFERALARDARAGAALLGRAHAWLSLGQLAPALADCEALLALEPHLAAAHDARGIALQGLGQYSAALAAFEQALQLKPDSADVLYRRAVALRNLERHADAAQGFAQVLARAPEYDYARGNLLHERLKICDWSDYAALVAEVTTAVDAGRRACLPGPFFAVCDSARLQLRCARTYVADKRLEAPAAPGAAVAHRHERIVVAYVSADFRTHPVAQLLAGVLEQHDRRRFEIIALSLSPADDSAYGRRIRHTVDRFLDVSALDDEAVAALMRELEVDIAVDLMGFSGGARPRLFARRPAPIQVNFLGFPGTLGSSCYDYIVGDRTVIPEQERDCCSEQVVYLPHSFQPNDGRRTLPARVPTRGECGLPEQGVVFCCFSSHYKITPVMFDIWTRLLRGAQGSVLWLAAGHESAARNLRSAAERRGVPATRLLFAPHIPDPAEHLARYRLADLFLDTLPYGAHATASDALWAGLPLLTCRGGSFAGRVAASLLQALECPQLIAASLEDYEARAGELARTPEALAELRATLHRNRLTTPLFDTERYTRYLEAAYQTMWERQQSGAPAAGFAVRPLP